MGFLSSSVVKNLPARQDTWDQSVDRDDPLEEGMATHSRVLAWRIPWTEEPGGLQSIGSHIVRYNGSNLARTRTLSANSQSV